MKVMSPPHRAVQGVCVCAVEEAVRCLEDNPLYDAGHGSVLNKAGEVRMDAIIIDGSK